MALSLSLSCSQFKPHPSERPLPLILGHPMQLTPPHTHTHTSLSDTMTQLVCSEHSAVILSHLLICLFPLKHKILTQGPCLPRILLLGVTQSGSSINICGLNEWNQMSAPEVCSLPSLSLLTRTKEDSGWDRSTEGCSLQCQVADTSLIQPSALPAKYTHSTLQHEEAEVIGIANTHTHTQYLRSLGENQVIYPEIISCL